MDATIAVGHAAARIVGHARRAHVVEAADWMRADQLIADPALVGIGQPTRRFHGPQAEAPQFPGERRHQSRDAVHIDVRQAPVERDPRHSGGVPFLVELDPAVGIGRLLGANDDRQVEPAQTAHQPGMERAGETGVAAHQLLGRFPHRAAGARRRGAMLEVEIGALGERMVAALRLPDGEGQCGVEQPFAPLQRFRWSNRRRYFHPVDAPLGEGRQPLPVGLADDAAAPAMGMLHEVAADQVVMIADAVRHDGIGRQQDARIFYPAGGQDILARPDIDRPA